MKTKFLLAAVCSVAIGLPALAMGAREMRGALAGPITRSAVEAKVKDHFAKVDANGDGYIDKAEVGAAREKMMAEMRDRHFKMMDANGDGSISRAEFDAAPHDMGRMGEAPPAPPAAGTTPAPPPPEAMMMGHEGRMGMMGGRGRGMAMMMGGTDRMFDRADTNKDGRVSLAEALALPLSMFDKADTNKDGTISPEERKAAHEKMRAEWMSRKAG